MRYSIPGDFAQVDADGTIHLLGPGLGLHQLGRREDLPRGGRGGAQDPRRRARRGRGRRSRTRPTASRSWRWSSWHDGADRAGRGRADRAREGAPGLVQGAPAGPQLSPPSGGRPTARSTTSATGPSRWTSSGPPPAEACRPDARRSAAAASAEPDCGDVHRPGRRHPRRGRMAGLRRVPSVRPPGRARRPRARDLPVVVPTQFVLEGDTVWLHLVRANPVFGALAENPRVLLSVADDWAFIPSSWKAIGERTRARDPDHLLRRGAAGRHGDGARRADGAGQRGRHPAPPAGGLPARGRRGRPG